MWDISTCLHKLISYWVRWRHPLPFNTKMSGNFIIVAHLLGVIGSPRAPRNGLRSSIAIQGTKWISVAGFIRGARSGLPEAGDRWWDSSWSETLTVHNTTSMQLLLFQPSSVLSSQTPVSHSQITARGAGGGRFSHSSFLPTMFCKDTALFFFFFFWFFFFLKEPNPCPVRFFNKGTKTWPVVCWRGLFPSQKE